MSNKPLFSIEVFIEPPTELTNLFCENGGEIIGSHFQWSNSAPCYRHVTFKIPATWKVSMFYSREYAHSSLKPFLDPASNEQLRYIVPDDPNREIYGVFFITRKQDNQRIQSIEIRPIQML